MNKVRLIFGLKKLFQHENIDKFKKYIGTFSFLEIY